MLANTNHYVWVNISQWSYLSVTISNRVVAKTDAFWMTCQHLYKCSLVVEAAAKIVLFLLYRVNVPTRLRDFTKNLILNKKNPKKCIEKCFLKKVNALKPLKSQVFFYTFLQDSGKVYVFKKVIKIIKVKN